LVERVVGIVGSQEGEPRVGCATQSDLGLKSGTIVLFSDMCGRLLDDGLVEASASRSQ
jgi:hypothetical protein